MVCVSLVAPINSGMLGRYLCRVDGPMSRDAEDYWIPERIISVLNVERLFNSLNMRYEKETRCRR
jgi:hypothetical protein